MTDPAENKLPVQNFLDNVSWKKESFLDGELIIHTISREKVSDKVSKTLEENNFKLIDVHRDQSITLKGKNFIEATEINEVHVEKLKVTEGSIVSHTNSSGKTQRVLINEGEPLEPSSAPAKQAGLPPAKVLSTADFRKVENERLVFRQEVSRKKNSFFFRATDGAALFKLGSSFYDAYKEGVHFFSFSNLQNDEAQKRSIIGIASFIHYHENLKILIVSSELKGSFFGKLKENGERESLKISSLNNFEYEVIVHEGLSYLELSDIMERSKKNQIKDQVYLIQSLLADYDLILFDLPDLKHMKTHYETYFPVLQLVQNVSFIVDLGKSTFSEINSLKDFFENYKVKVNGVIVEK